MAPPAAAIVHHGLHGRRLAPEQNNPREIAFAEAWAEENIDHEITMAAWGCTLDVLLDRRATQLEATAVATVIQWLGSNVGFSFLHEALEKCGYKIVERKAKPYEPSQG